LRFYDRENELGFCRKFMDSEKLEVLILYGRRRVGKTALILECTKDLKGIYFVGIKAAANEIFTRFSKAASDFLYLKGVTFTDWEAALRQIFEKSVPEKIYLVLDEFQYIAQSYPQILSILQILTDEYQHKSKLKLILCGSSISFMEGMLSYKNPLYGRATAKLRLLPVDFEDSKEFLPEYNWHELLEAYSIVGGIPMYLNLWDGKRTVFENISKLFLEIGAPLRDEPIFILMSELKEPRIYQSILEALSMGRNTSYQIASYIGFSDSRKVQPYLRKLEELSIVKRVLPALLKNPRRTRNIRYEISDQLFRFWYRFIFPNIDRLEIGDTDSIILSLDESFNQYVSFEFERQAMRKVAEITGSKRFGKYWAKGEEIDFLGETEHGLVAGEFKWWKKKVGGAVLNELKRKCKALSINAQKYVLASRAGFERELFNQKDVMLVILDRDRGWEILKRY